MGEERLQKILARAGIGSRRAAEGFITDGRVRVNGTVVRELGAKADPSRDRIEVEGHGRLEPEQVIAIALHKPAHVVSTVRDPEGRPTVLQQLEKSRAVGARRFEGDLPRVYPVGRLDFDAEGLILLTNDGPLAQVLTHPSYRVPRTYMVKVRGHPSEKALERLTRGVRLKNPDGSLGRPTAPADVHLVKKGASNAWLELTLFEGRNHQVKRMCDAVGHFAIRLVRIDYGGVELGSLPPGAWRLLTESEIKKLRGWAQGERHTRARPARHAGEPRPAYEQPREHRQRRQDLPPGERRSRPERRPERPSERRPASHDDHGLRGREQSRGRDQRPIREERGERRGPQARELRPEQRATRRPERRPERRDDRQGHGGRQHYGDRQGHGGRERSQQRQGRPQRRR